MEELCKIHKERIVYQGKCFKCLLEKEHKYKAKKVVIDGIKFPSTAEGDRYTELKLLKLSGQIKNFSLQPAFVLHAGVKYTADFKVDYWDGHEEIEDVKGFETKEFRIKEKLFRADYPDVILRIIGRKEKRRSKK